MSDRMKQYWKKNLGYLAILLSIWFLVSYLFGILLVEPLNSIRLGGFKLGFWFAQQGSIYTFVILIFVYVRLMNKLDKEFDVDEKVEAVKGVYGEIGIYELTQEKMNAYYDRAFELLERFEGEEDGKLQLKSFLQKLMKRDR